MNVIYLGKDKPHSTERYVKHALEQCGLTVNLYNFRPEVYNKVKKYLKEDDLKFVLFSKPHAKGCDDFLQLCKQRGVLTVCWQWDLFWGLRHIKPPQFNADYLYTTDGGHQHLWDKHYPHHRVLRQGIHGPQHSMYPSDYRWDIGFVGAVKYLHPSRRALIKHLSQQYGSRFNLIQNTRGPKLNQLLSRIKIIVGDSYPSPYYWSNRIYEIIGRGGFMLHPEVEGLEEEFIAGKHYATYTRDDFDGLDQTIQYYLDHDDERESIKRNGFDLMGSQYTYLHRVKHLLSTILESSQLRA